MIPLRDDDDNHLRDKTAAVAKLKAAYRRIIAQPEPVVNVDDEPAAVAPEATVRAA
jgi:hypothetical protein